MFLRSDISQGVLRGGAWRGLDQIMGGFLQSRNEFSLNCGKQWSDTVRFGIQAAHSCLADNMFEKQDEI